jgi:hypothetical protein
MARQPRRELPAGMLEGLLQRLYGQLVIVNAAPDGAVGEPGVMVPTCTADSAETKKR